MQLPDSRGSLVRIQDPLAARDTWVNTTYARFDYHGVAPAPAFQYSLRVDGIFDPDFVARLERDLGGRS